MESCFKERGKAWKDYTKGIMNEENDWDHNVEGDTGKDPEPSDISLQLTAAGRGVIIQVMTEICQCPRWIRYASRMGSKYSYSNLQGEGLHQELQLLQSCEAS